MSNMKGKEIVSINGKIFGINEAKISVLDHCFLYGDGVFEGIRFIDKKILFHKEHMQRLYRSASIIRLPLMTQKDYEKQLFAAVKASGLESGYVRVVATRGIGDMGINPKRCSNPKLVMIVTHIKIYPDELYEKGLHVIIAKTRKIPRTSLDCSAKLCNYLNNIMAAWEAVDKEADEAIMTDEDGIVSEATLDNIFGIKGNTIFTPSLDTNCLPGITRAKIMDIAKEQGMKVVEGRFLPKEFLSADEVFLTGTGAGIVPVTRIDESVIGNGKMGVKTRKLRQEYESRIRNFCTPIKQKSSNRYKIS